jgi:hypothetical protein
MAHDLKSLRQHRTGRRGEPFRHLHPAVQEGAWELLARYLAKHAARLPNARLYASLCAAASRVAQHGPPPNRWQRLGYRTAKRNRARMQLAEHGDPAAPNPSGSGTTDEKARQGQTLKPGTF